MPAPVPTSDTWLYGLHVRSEVPLHIGHPPTPPPDPQARPDVVIHAGESTSQDDELPGTTTIDLRTRERLCTGRRQPDGSHVLRFHGVCDVTIDASLASMTVQPVVGMAAEWPTLLATGTVMATLLTLRGQAVIHASAVHLGRNAVAFMGRSGMGKSTMATLCCADGATMLVDDVVHIDMSMPTTRCHRGPTEARLRPTAGDLASHFDAVPASRTTTDGRHALALPTAPDPLPPLAAIVIPLPDHDAATDHVEVEQLSTRDGMLALLEFPRVLGWQDPDVLAQLFREAGDIATRVPVAWARVPWGPPFARGLGDRLWAALADAGIDVHAPLAPAADQQSGGQVDERGSR